MTYIYVYNADIYCETCGENIIRHGKLAPHEDSGQYPQGPYSNGGGEADTPQHCCVCDAFLENPLTPEGLEWVKDALATRPDDGFVAFARLQGYAEFYGIDFDNPYAPEKPTLYSVAPYLIDRAYGGPEEGGWWYTCGEPVFAPDFPLPRFTWDEDEAWAWAEEMNAQLAPYNVGRRSIGSVLSEGVYQAEAREGMPAPYPEAKPMYE